MDGVEGLEGAFFASATFKVVDGEDAVVSVVEALGGVDVGVWDMDVWGFLTAAFLPPGKRMGEVVLELVG